MTNHKFALSNMDDNSYYCFKSISSNSLIFYSIPSFLISWANGMNHLGHMGVLSGTTLMKKISIFRKRLGHMGVLLGTTLMKKMRIFRKRLGHMLLWYYKTSTIRL